MRGVVTAYRGLLANRPLTRLLAGEFISSIGDCIYLVALLIIIYQRTQDGTVLGIVGAARVLPYVFLSIPAGIIADRYDRRLVLLVTDLGRALLMLVLAGLVAMDGSTEAIIATTILAACLSSFFGPAIGSYLPNLVKDESQLGPANSAYASLDNLAFIIGPAAAGILLAATGNLALAFLLNAISFAVIAVILWGLPPSTAARRASAATAAGAAGDDASRVHVDWSTIRVPLGGLILFEIVSSFVFGGIGILTVIIAYDLIGGGEAATGALNAAMGLGGLIGALVSSVLVLRRRLGPPLLVGAVLLGGSVAALGVSGGLGFAMLALAGAAIGALLASVVSETLGQRIVPDVVRGRVLGVTGTTSVLAYAAGAFLLPTLVDVLGIAPVLLACGLAIVAVALAAVVALGPWAVQAPAQDALRARLSALPIFSGLPPARLELAERRSVIVPMRAGDVVIRQGEPADRFYAIGSGVVEVTQVRPADGAPVMLRRMGVGEGFGEIGLLAGSSRTATVTATSDGSLIALDGDAFLELVNGMGITSPFMEPHWAAAGAAAS